VFRLSWWFALLPAGGALGVLFTQESLEIDRHSFLFKAPVTILIEWNNEECRLLGCDDMVLL
jgi:hypothetical protein